MRGDYLNRSTQKEDFKKAVIPSSQEEKFIFFSNRIFEIEEWLANHPKAPPLVNETLLLNYRLFELVKEGKV